MFNTVKTFFSSWIDSFKEAVEEPFPDWVMYENKSQYQWQLLSSDAKVPLRATDGSAGFDLCSSVQELVLPRTRCWIATGIAISFPKGMVGFVWPRSGLAGKGIDTSAGVIDSDYRGEIKVLLVNNSDDNFIINKGDRIAQLIIVETLHPGINFDVVDCLNYTERGTNGFGSTGK